jgi:hypothetical protein
MYLNADEKEFLKLEISSYIHSFISKLYIITGNKYIFVCLFYWIYVTPKQYRSYGDVPALLVEEDRRRPSVHYLRHERVPE